MSDSYSSDPAKAKKRETAEEFTANVLPKERQHATAVYLAGTNSKESELLDRCGIPRANRLILEWKLGKLGKVRHENRGIRVIHMSTHDFLDQGYKDYPQYFPLWYCGLDYEYMLNKKVIRDLKNIAQHELMLDGGVLYTNIVGAHEEDYLKELYLKCLFRRATSSYLFQNHFRKPFEEALSIVNPGDLLDNRNGGQVSELIEPTIRKMSERLSSDELNLLRNLATITSIQESLLEPEKNIFLDAYCPGSARLIQPTGNIDAHACAAEPVLMQTPEGKKISFGALPIPLLFQNMLENSQRVGKDRALCEMACSIERHAIHYYQKGGLCLIPSLFRLTERKGYVPYRMESYSYISNRNTLMLFDILQAKKCKPIVRNIIQQLADKNIKILYGPHRPYLARENVRTGNPDETQKSLLLQLEQESTRHLHWLEDSAPYLEYLNPYTVRRHHYSRKSLASAHRPALMLQQARRCAREGWTNEQVEEKFIVSKQGWLTLGACRAHATRKKQEKKQ